MSIKILRVVFYVGALLLTTLFVLFLYTQMPNDGAGFLYHYQTMLSVLVAALALMIPFIEHLLSRKKRLSYVRLKARMIAVRAHTVFCLTWPHASSSFRHGARNLRQVWKEKAWTDIELKIDDAEGLDEADMQRVAKIITMQGMTNARIAAYEDDEYSFDFNSFNTCSSLLVCLILVSAELSQDSDLIAKAQKLETEQAERIERHIAEGT